MRASNRTRNVVLADRIRRTEVSVPLMKGRVAANGLSDGEGLWISPWSSSHSSLRHYEFDALFLDVKNRVVGVCQRFRGYGAAHAFLCAGGVLELPAGMIEKTKTGIGDAIGFEEPAGGIL